MSSRPISSFLSALPFWLSLVLVPLALIATTQGGWTVALMPLYAWALITVLDVISGLNTNNPDPMTPVTDLFWYRLITMIWFPLQFCVIYGTIWYVTRTDHLSALELIVLFFGIGAISGTIGIVYSHELLHQKNKLER